ncbi:helix-turn-helix domain-containing protein [Actinacidiphila alni]|uniref:helix-turn-helix domain-containing protein n=1 Tax=Actinacidiphila alni TaxID=380248 RepID=UPI0033D4B4B3
MLEWEDLVAGPAPLLRAAGAAAGAVGRSGVQRVLLARESAAAGWAGAAGALLVADAGETWLGRPGGPVGAAGIVVVGDDAVAERAARPSAVPVFVPAEGVRARDATALWGLLLARCADAAADRAARAEALVAEVARGAAESGPAADAAARLARWCADRLGAPVRIVPPSAAASLGTEADELARGRVRGPVELPGAVAVAAGPRTPRPVVVAEGERAWSADQLLFLEQVAACAALLTWAADVGARDVRLTEAERELRIAALQQLMAGDLVRAGRTVEPLVPGLLAAGAGAVAIVECAPGESRSVLYRAVDSVVLRRTLTVRCPVSDRQVIVIHPAGAGALDELLGPVVSAVRGRSAGVSAVTPWPRTAAAYDGALAALAAARGTAGRISVHDGRGPLSERLGARARAWAATVTRPLLDVPFAEREELLRLGEQTLWWGESAAARLVGWHRHTLARRLDALGRHTGLDPADPWQRAALCLAVRLAPSPEPVAPVPGLTLARALDEPEARAWARSVIDPLPPELRRTLATWAAHGMRPEPAVAALSLSRTTLYKRLARACEVTHLEFTRYPGPAAEALLALHLTGDVPFPQGAP